MEESIFEECVYVPLCGNDRSIDQRLLKIQTTEMSNRLIPKMLEEITELLQHFFESLLILRIRVKK